MRRKSQIPLPRPHVAHAHRRRIPQRRAVHEVPQDFHEALHLPQLVRHAGPRRAVRSRHAELHEELSIPDRLHLWPVVRSRQRRGESRARRLHLPLAAVLRAQLPVARRREKMRLLEIIRQPLLDRTRRIRRRIVARHIAIRMAQCEANRRARLQLHEPPIHIPQSALTAPPAQRDFHKGLLLQTVAQLLQKSAECVHLHITPRAEPV